MFELESNGYKREEVDKYVAQLKNQLLQYRLDTLEAEQKALDIKKKAEELDVKEKSIMKAINAFEDSQKAQQESSKNIYALKIEQMELVNNKAAELIRTICNRHPEINHDDILAQNIEDFNDMIKDIKKREEVPFITSRINTENDSIRMLLGKMQEYRKAQDSPREVHIERKDISKNTMQSDVNYESGFNLEEAVNPKQDLKEIMKAFDFFNSDEKF